MIQKDFDLEYGRRLIDPSEKTFFIILVISFLITYGIVLYLANIDYENLRNIVNSDIADRYITYLINSDIAPAIVEREDDSYLVELSDAIGAVKVTTKPILPFDGPAIIIDIEAIGELTTPAIVKQDDEITGFYRSAKDDAFRELPTWLNEQVEVFEYSIARKAEITIKKPKYLLEKKESFGYRDQEKTLNVIYAKSDGIELCYNKQSRRTWVKEGFVKVEFQISPKGFVLPNTIKIIESTILNRSVEQCIIKNIRRWREFEKLDSSQGAAKVTHKFIFR